MFAMRNLMSKSIRPTMVSRRMAASMTRGSTQQRVFSMQTASSSSSGKLLTSFNIAYT